MVNSDNRHKYNKETFKGLNNQQLQEFLYMRTIDSVEVDVQALVENLAARLKFSDELVDKHAKHIEGQNKTIRTQRETIINLEKLKRLDEDINKIDKE